MWNQVREVTALNLRSVPQRLGSSAVTVLGIAGVVVVFVGILSMAQGFQRTMMTGGDPLTAIVLRSGASSETGSLLGLDTVRLVKDAPGIARENGRSQASAEFAVVVRHAQAGTGRAMNIRLRGVEPAAFDVRDEIRVVDGRPFQPGRLRTHRRPDCGAAAWESDDRGFGSVGRFDVERRRHVSGRWRQCRVRSVVRCRDAPTSVSPSECVSNGVRETRVPREPRSCCARPSPTILASKSTSDAKASTTPISPVH